MWPVGLRRLPESDSRKSGDRDLNVDQESAAYCVHAKDADPARGTVSGVQPSENHSVIFQSVLTNSEDSVVGL